MTDREKEFEKMADIVDKLECPDFALWLLLRRYTDRLENEIKEMKVNSSQDAFTLFGMNEADRALQTITADLSTRLWG